MSLIYSAFDHNGSYNIVENCDIYFLKNVKIYTGISMKPCTSYMDNYTPVAPFTNMV